MQFFDIIGVSHAKQQGAFDGRYRPVHDVLDSPAKRGNADRCEPGQGNGFTIALDRGRPDHECACFCIPLGEGQKGFF